MKRTIALFRGLNVGGNRLSMKDLVGLLEGIGCKDVRTYIQSGNAIFESQTNDPKELSTLISAVIKKSRGFEPEVFLLQSEDIKQAMANNPFPEGEKDPKALHLGFLAAKPENADMMGLEKLRSESEKYQLIENVFYLYAPDGVGRSKLAANAERLLGVGMTDRNWRSVVEILKIADQIK
jgi:uncharacterized protein (DUF1697 family)